MEFLEKVDWFDRFIRKLLKALELSQIIKEANFQSLNFAFDPIPFIFQNI